MKQSITEQVKELKKQLDNKPSMCKHCKLEINNGVVKFICERTERHTFFGTKAKKCYGDCVLYEKDIPEMIEDAIYSVLKNKIEKLKDNLENRGTEKNSKLFESGYFQCQKDVLEIIEKMSSLRRNNL